MKSFTFLKKEIIEIFKTSKIFILPPVLLIFGFSSPLFTKLTPKLFESIAKQTNDSGIAIRQTREIVFSDSYSQYYNNLFQVCIIVLILVFMGLVAEEKVRGTAVLVLTKRVSRTNFIVSKFVSGSLLFTVSFAVSALVCILYTYLLFGQFYTEYLFLSFLCYWIFGIMTISITLFFSTIGKSSLVSALMSFAAFIVISAASAVPFVRKFTPGSLSGLCMGLAQGSETVSAGDALLPAITAVLLAVLFVAGSIAVFKRQEL